MKILVTGATGFVGSALVPALVANGHRVVSALRTENRRPSYEAAPAVVVGDIAGETDWAGPLRGVDCVVHLAARVHVTEERATDPLAAFSSVNVGGTARLARQAVDAGVRRLIYLSSIKVNGESTDGRPPFSETDVPSPEGPYAVSKWRAEEALREIADSSGLEVVVVRPPLVYGPGVKANFLSMMRWLKKGIPLPFGAVDNRRSLLSLDNLVDLLVTVTDHPAAANQTFLAADGEDLSTPELLERTASALGKSARLVPVPVPLLKAGATAVGKRGVVQRLCGSLQVDIGKAQEVLGWSPRVSVEKALRETARHFLEARG